MNATIPTTFTRDDLPAWAQGSRDIVDALSEARARNVA